MDLFIALVTLFLFLIDVFFLFSHFVSVYVCASLCDFVCIALLLLFVLGFCLSNFLGFFFLSIVFSGCYHWWICFLVWLLSSFFLFYYLSIFYIFNNFLFFILIILFYFVLFLLFFLFFFLSFFLSLSFLLSRVADRVVVFQSSVRPEPLRWEGRVQDTDPPETSWLHIISNGESSPRALHLNAKTQLYSMTSKLQCRTLYAKQLSRQEHNPTH